MAISVTMGNPIKVTGDTAAAAVVTALYKKIQKVIWHNIATAGHLLSMTDTDGAQKLKGIVPTFTTASAIQYDFPKGLPCYGIKIDDMDSGEVYIYTE